MMGGRFAAFLVISLSLAATSRAADDIVLRTTISPEEGWVGQQLKLNIDVLALDGWAQLSKISDTEVPGAYMLRLESQGTRLSETIDGGSYTGQRYEFMVYTQRDGSFLVPSIPVDVEVRRYGAGGGNSTRRLSTPPVEFAAKMPPGATGIHGLISTTRLSASQDWSTESGDAMVGDAIKRSITLRADNVSAMAFMPITYPDIQTVATYPEQADVDDRFDRGTLRGSRVEAVTYVLEAAGEIELPAVEIIWWDLRAEELKRIDLPGLSLNVAPDPLLTTVPAMPQGTAAPERSYRWWVLLVLSVAAVFFGRHRIQARWAAWRAARNDAEAAYFNAAMRAIGTGDQAIFLRHTMRWLDRINTDSEPARLDRFLLRYAEPEALTLSSELLRLGSSGGNDLVTLGRHLRAARKNWLKSLRIRRQTQQRLPELNY